MGGGFALLVAGRPGWSAASVNYGMVPDDAAGILRGACPVVASFGGRDRSMTGAAGKISAALDEAGVNSVSPLTTLLKVSGVGYDHDAAADAKRRILAFFDTHLRRGTTGD